MTYDLGAGGTIKIEGAEIVSVRRLPSHGCYVKLREGDRMEESRAEKMGEPIKAQVFTDYDAFEAAKIPGSVLFAGEGGRLWLHHHCPGCGERSGLRLFETVKSESPSWKLESRDPVTLSPSVHHSGGCGWHGFLQNGVWSSC